jgi:hypothetical protein
MTKYRHLGAFVRMSRTGIELTERLLPVLSIVQNSPKNSLI